MNTQKKMVLFFALFFGAHVFATTNNKLENLYKKIFNNRYKREQKITLIDQVLNQTDTPDQDRNTLRNLKMIINIFIQPSEKITPNSVLSSSPKETIMHWAAKLDQDHLMEILFQNGAQVDPRNQWNKTPLHYAAEWNSPKAAQLLLNKGADSNARDQYGKNPLDYAQELRKKEVLAVLNKRTNKINGRAANLCSKTDYTLNMQKLRDLQDPYMALNIVYKILFTCSAYTTKERINLIDLVLDRNDTPENDRKTLNKLKMIIATKKTITSNIVLSTKTKETILHWAVKSNLAHLVKILLQLGASVKARDKASQTPLHYAAQFGSPEIVQLLLIYKSDTNARDKNKKIALDYAKKRKNKKITTLLSNKVKKVQSKRKPQLKSKLRKVKTTPKIKKPSNKTNSKHKLKRAKSY